MTTIQYQTTPQSGHAGRSCGLAALILSIALLATGCLAPYGTATQGEVADLRKAQDDGFRDIKFTLDKISAKLDTQSQTEQSDTQTTLEQLARIREALNTMTGGHIAAPTPRPAGTPAVTPTPVSPGPTATPIVRPTPTQATPPVIGGVEPTPAPQPDTPERQKELLDSAAAEYKAGRLDQVINICSAFLKNNASAPGADTATYYLSACYYSQAAKNNNNAELFEKALAGYKNLLDNYPNSPITKQTLKARAQCEKVLGRTADERATLLKWQGTFPDYDPEDLKAMQDALPAQ